MNGTPVDIQIANNGNLWIKTEYPNVLYQNIGLENWIEHKNFGTNEAVCICDFAVDKNIVWVATDKGAAKYDGSEWRFFPDAVVERPVSIAASQLGIFIIDQAGNLSQYIDDKWHISNIETLLPSIPTEATHSYISLNSEANGNIVLQWKGIWRFDGVEWTELTINDYRLDTIDLVGITDDLLWTQWGGGLAVSNDTGSDWSFYEFEQIAVPEVTRFYSVASFNGVTTFGTDQGILRLDDGDWDLSKTPDFSAAKIEQVFVLPDNRVWVVTGNTSVPLVTVMMTCTSTLFVIFFLVTLIIMQIRLRRRLVSMRGIIDALLPDSPQIMNPKQIYWPLFAILILFIAVIIWPSIFSADSPTIFYVLIFILFFVWIVQNMAASMTSDSKKQFDAINLRTTFTALGVVMLWAAGLIFITSLISNMSSSLGIVFAIFWVVAPIIWMQRYYRSLYQKRVEQGEYDKALAHLNSEIQKQPERSVAYWMYKAIYGDVALVAGRLEEAEGSIKEALTNTRNSAAYQQSNKTTQISSSIMYQGRYEEALKFAEAAIRLNPTSRNAWTNLVTLYLYCDLEKERSIEVAEFGQKYGITTWYDLTTGHHTDLYDRATYAWALAQVNRINEADRIMQKLRQQLNRHHNSSVAFFYYIQGKIEQTKGNPAQAAEWFTKANQTDSGLYGQLAAKALSNFLNGERPTGSVST